MTDQETIRKLLDDGLTAYGLGDVEEALGAWRQVLMLEPDNERAKEYINFVQQNWAPSSDPPDMPYRPDEGSDGKGAQASIDVAPEPTPPELEPSIELQAQFESYSPPAPPVLQAAEWGDLYDFGDQGEQAADATIPQAEPVELPAEAESVPEIPAEPEPVPVPVPETPAEPEPAPAIDATIEPTAEPAAEFTAGPSTPAPTVDPVPTGELVGSSTLPPHPETVFEEVPATKPYESVPAEVRQGDPLPEASDIEEAVELALAAPEPAVETSIPQAAAPAPAPVADTTAVPVTQPAEQAPEEPKQPRPITDRFSLPADIQAAETPSAFSDAPALGPTPPASATASAAGGAAQNGLAGDAVLGLVAGSQPPPAEAPPPAQAQSEGTEAESLLRGARDLLELDDFSGAVDLLDKLLEDHPSHNEAQRMRAEAQSSLVAMLESKVGDVQRIPRVRMAEDEIIWLNLDHRAGFMLSLVDGHLTFDEILSVSNLSPLEGMRIIVQLINEKVIEVT